MIKIKDYTNIFNEINLIKNYTANANALNLKAYIICLEQAYSFLFIYIYIRYASCGMFISYMINKSFMNSLLINNIYCS